MADQGGDYDIPAHWFPTGSETETLGSNPTDVLRLNPKCLLSVCFGPPDQLADPCVMRATLPEWVTTARERGALWPDGPQGLTTPHLLWVVVSPRVWAWARWANRAALKAGATLLDCQSRTLSLLDAYAGKRFPRKELDDAVAFADRQESAGARMSEVLLPQVDPGIHWMIRHGLMGSWHGYRPPADRQVESTRSVPPPPAKPPLPTTKSAGKSRRPADAGPTLFETGGTAAH